MFAINNRFELVSSAPETNKASLRGVRSILTIATYTPNLVCISQTDDRTTTLCALLQKSVRTISQMSQATHVKMECGCRIFYCIKTPHCWSMSISLSHNEQWFVPHN
jgi:hypothetical protein